MGLGLAGKDQGWRSSRLTVAMERISPAEDGAGRARRPGRDRSPRPDGQVRSAGFLAALVLVTLHAGDAPAYGVRAVGRPSLGDFDIKGSQFKVVEPDGDLRAHGSACRREASTEWYATLSCCSRLGKSRLRSPSADRSSARALAKTRDAYGTADVLSVLAGMIHADQPRQRAKGRRSGCRSGAVSKKGCPRHERPARVDPSDRVMAEGGRFPARRSLRSCSRGYGAGPA